MSQTRIRPTFHWLPDVLSIQKFGSVILVAAIAFGGYYAAHYLLPGSGHPETEPEQGTETVEGSLKTLVVLSDEKVQAANLTLGEVQQRPFQPSKKVPGTIAYDAAKKVDLRAAVDAVVEQVLVEPGQTVKAGDELLVLTGPEIGQARIAIEQAKTNLKLAQTEFEWAKKTNANLLELLALLGQQPTLDQVNEAFVEKMLGEHRDEILSAYSQFLLAQKSVERGVQVDTRGVIPDRVLDERQSSLEVANAKYNGMIEESKFQSAQDFTKASGKLTAAESELEICQDRLNTLLGPFGDPVHQSSEIARKNLSRFVLTAPRDGQVVDLIASSSSRFAAGEVMLVIAETSDVWVEAQITQRDLQTLDLSSGQALSVTVPGLADKTFRATIRFFNSSVSPTTLAIPLVAELNNDHRTFRPGMFVWVSIPTGSPTETITVPVGAVQRDGNDIFVFLSEGDGEFRRVDIEIGLESEGWIEVKSGLTSGDRLVNSGAFFLKSELLLEAE